MTTASIDAAQNRLATDAFLPGDDTGGRVAHVGGLEVGLGETGVDEGGLDRFTADRLQAPLQMLAEGGHSHPGHNRVHLHRFVLFL